MKLKMKSMEDRKEETLEAISDTLNSISVDDLKSDGFTVRSGNKVLKLSVTGEYSLDKMEEEIKEEYKEKLSKNLANINRIIIKKLDDMSKFVSSIKKEYEDKTEKLEKRLESSEIMPNITPEHGNQGLSLTKGYDGRLIWMFQSVYWPKYVDNRKIEESYSRRLINHIIITVETLGNSVMSVGVKKPIGLGDFDHYHRNCWGNWKHTKEWKTPDDIIRICKEAEVVLETINTGSLASNSPQGLMRVATLMKHSVPMESSVDFKANRKAENIGVSTDFTRDNIWSV
jgi:hypothetical protein